MRTIITTTINRVVTGNVGRVVVGTDGDKSAHFTATPRSSHAPANDASYRAYLDLGRENLMRAVGTLASLASQALSWLEQPAKRPMPAHAKCAVRRPATGLPRSLS